MSGMQPWSLSASLSPPCFILKNPGCSSRDPLPILGGRSQIPATRKSCSGRKWSKFAIQPRAPCQVPEQRPSGFIRRTSRSGFICSYVSCWAPCVSLIFLSLLHPCPLVIYSNLLERGDYQFPAHLGEHEDASRFIKQTDASRIQLFWDPTQWSREIKAATIYLLCASHRAKQFTCLILLNYYNSST